MQNNYELDIDLVPYKVSLEKNKSYTIATIDDCYGSVLKNLDPQNEKKKEKHNSAVFFTPEDRDYEVRAFPVEIFTDSIDKVAVFVASSDIKEEDLLEALAEYVSDNYDAMQEIGYEVLITSDNADEQATEWNEKYGTLATETNLYKEKKTDKIANIKELQYKYRDKDSMQEKLSLLEKEISEIKDPIMGGVENAYTKEKDNEKVFLKNAIDKEIYESVLRSGMIFRKGNQDKEGNREILVNFESGKWNKNFLKNIGTEEFLNNEKDTCFLYEDERGLSQIAKMESINKKEVLFTFDVENTSNAFLLYQIELLAKGKKNEDNLKYAVLNSEEVALSKIQKEQGILQAKATTKLKEAPLALKKIAKEFLSIGQGFFEDITKYDVPAFYEGWHSSRNENKKDSDLIVGIRTSGTTIINLNVEDFGEDIKKKRYAGVTLQEYIDDIKDFLFTPNNERFFIVKDGYQNDITEITKEGAKQAIDIFEKELSRAISSAQKKATDFMVLGEKIFSERLRTKYKTKDDFLERVKEMDTSLSYLSKEDLNSIWDAKTSKEIGAIFIGKEIQKEGVYTNRSPRKYDGIERTATRSGLYSGLWEMREDTKKDYSALLSEVLPKDILEKLKPQEGCDDKRDDAPNKKSQKRKRLKP